MTANVFRVSSGNDENVLRLTMIGVHNKIYKNYGIFTLSGWTVWIILLSIIAATKRETDTHTHTYGQKNSHINATIYQPRERFSKVRAN